MSGTSSVPACAVGSVFAEKNPRMDSQRPQEQPASVPVYVVGNHRYFTEREAQRAAEASTRWDNTPTEIKVGTFHLDGLQHFKSVTPAEAASAAAERAARLGIEVDTETEADSLVESLTMGETCTATEVCNRLGITADSFDGEQAGQTVMDAVNGIVEAVPLETVGETSSSVLPETGLFTLDQWAAVLGCSAQTVRLNAQKFKVGLTDGFIKAEDWWRAFANSSPNDDATSYVAPTSKAVGTAFDTASLGADSLSANVSLPELTGPVDYIAKTDPRTSKKKGPFVAMDPPAWHSLPICGLVTIAVDQWEPKSRLDVPPSPMNAMGMELAAQFAIAFNQSIFARQRRRWCVVTNRGTCLMLTGIPIDQRPLNPCDFPPCVQQGMTYPEAELIADEQNTERFKVARIPRNWTVSLRRADSVCETVHA